MVLPLSLLRTSQGHPMLVELKNGETYNGHLVSCDNWMNICLRDVICTSRDGDRFWKLPELVVRGNNIKYLRIPEEARDARPRLEPITASSVALRQPRAPHHTPFAPRQPRASSPHTVRTRPPPVLPAARSGRARCSSRPRFSRPALCVCQVIDMVPEEDLSTKGGKGKGKGKGKGEGKGEGKGKGKGGGRGGDGGRGGGRASGRGGGRGYN